MKLRLLTLIVAVTLMPMALLARNYDMTFTDEKPEAALQIIKESHRLRVCVQQRHPLRP